MHPVAVAAKGKGTWNAVRRAGAIGARYGIGPRRMGERLAAVLDLVDRCGCRATLPVVATVAERNRGVVARYAALGLEFAVHGLHHVDHTDLPRAVQLDQLGRAKRTLEGAGIPVRGFRAPYLRVNEATLDAVRHNDFLYDASQAFHWPLGLGAGREAGAYGRALDFYGSLPAAAHPVVPWLDRGIVRIPYCLPDDESVVDRLGLTPDEMTELWLGVLRATHDHGELFTLAVHPERIESCAIAIAAVLDAARSERPRVWVPRHDEMAGWWRARTAAVVTVADARPGWLRVTVRGPDGLTTLARHLEIPGAEPWAGEYVRVHSTELTVPAVPRPFVGVHPAAPAMLTAFLREQGYIVETSPSARAYGCFVERRSFAAADRRPLLAEIETGAFPLLRMGRWPDGARSALSVTGDVDALTIGDFALRLLGR